MDKSVLTTRLFGLAIVFTFIVLVLGAFTPQVAYAQQGWNRDSKGFWYEYDNKGHYYKNGWQKIQVGPDSGEQGWFFFQKNGYAKEGWLKDGKNWYYLEGDADTNYSYGEGVWETLKTFPQYAEINGMKKQAPVMLAGNYWLIGKKHYCFDEKGRMKTGWVELSGSGSDGIWVYANSSGELVQGWKKIVGKWYYFDMDYLMCTGWVKTGGTQYYLKSSGAMVTGWQKISGQWYYFASSGAMQKNKWIGNYYVQDDGSMAVNTWIGKYHVDKNGKWDKTR